jgi:hypothetical protein
MPEAAQPYSLTEGSVIGRLRADEGGVSQHSPPPHIDHPKPVCYRGGTLHPGRNDSVGGLINSSTATHAVCPLPGPVPSQDKIDTL